MDGLGTDLATIKRLCQDDMVAVDLIDRVTARPHGGDHSKFDSSKLARTAATGTTRDYALRRLRKYRPDLHALDQRCQDCREGATAGASVGLVARLLK